MFFVSGGAIVMTLFAAYGMYLLRTYPGFIFWLSLTAQAQIAIVFTGLLGLLVKRTVKFSRNEVVISDYDANNQQSGRDSHEDHRGSSEPVHQAPDYEVPRGHRR